MTIKLIPARKANSDKVGRNRKKPRKSISARRDGMVLHPTKGWRKA